MRRPGRHSINQPAINQRAVSQLARVFSGEIIVPGDRDYAGARKVWNRAVDKRPAIIARCANRDYVVRAVAFARARDLLAAVRSGGHSFAGYGVCDGGIVIDVSTMKTARVDAHNATIIIGPGISAASWITWHRRSRWLCCWARVL